MSFLTSWSQDLLYSKFQLINLQKYGCMVNINQHVRFILTFVFCKSSNSLNEKSNTKI